MITSPRADEVSPAKLMGLVRGRWSLENGPRFLKDRWWDEDRHWSIRPELAERLAMPRDSALAASRVVPGLDEDMPIRARAAQLGRRIR